MKAALLFALILGACAPSFAADTAPPANRYAATIVPAERFDVGSLLVERHGQRGTPLILVPGLGSGAWAWQDTVRRFSTEHVVYVVTLAGFDGRKPVAGNPIDNARQSLRELIVSRKLDRPVLIGHSLGAALSIAFAEQDSGLIRGVVAIDGLPVMPGSENMPPAQRAAIAASVKARMAGGTREQFEMGQQQYMRAVGVVDMGRADELAKLSARSDQAAMGEAAAALFATDMRPGLADIKVPVLLIAPYFEPDASQRGLTREMAATYYTSLMAGTPKLQVVSIAPSRHFVMFDQPDMLADAVGAWLKSL
ncbi:MAG TPA: alpha/beta hydrolase [Telluria sp.]|nr:alpha/beta hydrolase [Telluria sp.]